MSEWLSVSTPFLGAIALAIAFAFTWRRLRSSRSIGLVRIVLVLAILANVGFGVAALAWKLAYDDVKIRTSH